MVTDVNVLALCKGQEKYIYVFDDASLPLLFHAFCDQAANPQLALNWFDVTVLKDRAHQQVALAGEASGPEAKGTSGSVP